MKRHLMLASLAATALGVTGLAGALPSASANSATPTASSAATASHTVHACTTHPAPGYATCLAVSVADASGKALRTPAPLPAGFTPTDVQAAYNLKGLSSHGRTVAIVDAYGYSNLAKDLAAYRSHYDLPKCTVRSGCLTIMDQHGGTNYPPDNSGWDLEQALDVDAVSAACPDCKILVVQAKSASVHNLGIAVNQAARQSGVAAISNSYIGHDRTNRSAYNHRGIAVTAASGDGGWQGGQYPAEDSHVVAVGGTSVTADGSRRGYSETVWGGAGSGCASETNQPKWQQDINTGCKTRAVSDVSAAANPGAGGLIIYYNGQFQQVGGTSEASPIIASVYALSGNTGGYPARFPYKSPNRLYDITSGSNGSCGAPLCTAGNGWDGPTGVGSPNGVKGF